MTDSNPNESRRRWCEPTSAVLMALVTLTRPWCSHQAATRMSCSPSLNLA